MGWPWKDSASSSPSSRDSLWRRGEEDDGERRGTRKVVRSNCTTEEVEPGKFVRKCEKTEQILRDCVGRPPEVIESKTEHTEEDVTDDMAIGTSSLDSSEFGPFSFPGLGSDIEAIERGIAGGFNTFLQAAEEMENELLRSFGIPPHHRASSPFHRQVPLEEPHKRADLDRGRASSAYDEFAGKIREI